MTIKRSAALGWVLAAVLAAASPVSAQTPTDDTQLFSADPTAPNVVIIMDTSGSMRRNVYHPDYDPATSTSSCSYFSSDQYLSSTQTSWAPWGSTAPSGCQARTIPVDASNTQTVRYEAAYLNWIFDSSNDTAAGEIASDTVALACTSESYSKYGRSRITAGKHVLREVICQIAASVSIRFSLAQFRDGQGGFVVVEAANWTTAQETALTNQINAFTADDYTPLSEALFQIYTYFMSRVTANLKSGEVSGTFPRYDYDLSGADDSTPPTADPVISGCQKQFVILITDGEPYSDNFESTGGKSGWSTIDDLIGDLDTGDGSLAISNRLNDLAKQMHTTDFRPDFDGDQTIDVYTVGFNTNSDTNALLQRTALMGGGSAYTSNNPQQLTASLVAAFQSIAAKAQSFTAATVPASRTTDGDAIYLSYFLPQTGTPFWPGHLIKLEFTALGELKDADGDCALLDANGALSCYSGSLDPDATPIWDAADEFPTPSNRELYVSTTSATSGAVPPALNTTNVTDAELGIVVGDISNYPDSTATTAAELAAEIVGYARGCDFDDPTCTTGRTSMLGDVFHSNPVVVGVPNAPINQSHYRDFARYYKHRTRVLYAGANDGFLHGFEASVYQTSPAPAFWDDGTGEEVYGFMPWQARQNLKEMPIDTPPRDFYFVDGSPQVSDVRFYGGAQESVASRVWTQWHTVLIGGLRQGGSQYYAVDVTNPNETSEGTAGYPFYGAYLWEFPCEANSTLCNSPRAHMGETWAEPVVTRVRVSVNDDGGAHERWVAVLTGGYSETGDPNHASYSATATAGRAIFIVDIKTGEILAEKKFNAAASSGDPEKEMLYSIASTPAVFDYDFDGYADVIMVGDLGGNMWKWVIHDVGGDPINGTDPSDDEDQPNWAFKKFFSAPSFYDSGSSTTFYKSFFFPPTGTLKDGKLVFAMATGERANLTANFVTSELGDNNRLYVITDLDPLERATNATLLESNLENLTDETTCNDTSTYKGYYVVGRDGEKFVTRLQIFFGDLFAGSFIHGDNSATCDADGESFLYRLGLECGDGLYDATDATSNDAAGRRRTKVGAGLPASPRFSVGPTTDHDPDDPPPCTSRVIMLTSDGSVSNECPKPLEGAGAKVETWRQR